MNHRITGLLLAAIKAVPARAQPRQMLAALINTFRRGHLPMLALMPGCPPGLRFDSESALSFSRASRRRCARDFGESCDGGCELLRELRFTCRSSSSIRSSCSTTRLRSTAFSSTNSAFCALSPPSSSPASTLHNYAHPPEIPAQTP